ncbi:adaptor protein MecA [Fictibacillus enclensis]|uniref:Adapter protein MecA n=1 Tax=Fictibacillus enclensis TaxID=1017270 RepID=A0A0V8JDA7_9BACL|nr:adaptor protein MecA [Fictibacillus enclensis]KSU84860.1 adaptor protein MecA [Fictibacillus enclensis]MDM5198630.1 adaptor protein MecA [Fictibacillus enclensis]MDM5337833.1 adaptor protein MecA [Fictibacillus enclensis]WHY74195.1 adaptor protein MecA [Fictibacillus enclensis]SCB86972.1 adapter protein MecA 1/2 [Fictibacillus enclensis]
MEIERVNEFTIKFFITYRDIEDRGFDREEIWSDRERGEELFWEMMDEAHQQEQFPLEGPLWIQVQALDKGLEIIVTRAQMSKDGTKLELPLGDEKIDLPVDKNIEKILDQQFATDDSDIAEDIELADEDYLSFLLAFKDFEDMIMLSHNVDSTLFANSLYHFENKYYLYVTFNPETTDREQDDLLSQLLEYGADSDASIHRIQEYGKQIIAEHALEEVSTHFNL